MTTLGDEKENISPNVLQKLEETYDLTYWKALDKSTQDKIKEEIATGSYRNKGLQTLILNYLNQVPPPAVRYIYGTQSVSSCILDDMKIYFFGDVHNPYVSEDVKCPTDSMISISNYLEKVFTSTQVPIDFYIEMFLPRKRLEYQKRDRDIVRLRNLVGECVSVDKKGCSYPAVRRHYIDLRQDPEYPFLGAGSQVIPPYKFNYLVAYLQHDYKKAKKLEFNFTKLKKSLSKVKPCYKSYISRLAEKQMKKMDNQIVEGDSNINRAYNTIMAYCQRPDRQIVQQNLKVVLPLMYENILALPGLQTNKILFDLIQKFSDIVFKFFSIAVGSAYLDVYTVTRICRVFNQVPNKFSGDPRNVIVFAGNAHIRNLVDIFLNLGAKKVVSYKSVEDATVNSVKCTEGLPVPLFAKF